MAIRIFDLYEQFRGRINEHQGGHARISDFIQWVIEAQMEIYNGHIERFQKTQKISDEITPFLQSFNVLVSANSGTMWDLVKKPAGYENFAAARIVKIGGKSCGCKGLSDVDEGEIVDGKCGVYYDEDELAEARLKQDMDTCELPIELVDNDRWGAVCNHPRKRVTCKTPKMTQYSGGFKIYPKGCGTTVIMDFFRLPVNPVYNYTVINPQQENEYFQYVAAGSVDLEWSEQLLPTFLNILIAKYERFIA